VSTLGYYEKLIKVWAEAKKKEEECYAFYTSTPFGASRSGQLTSRKALQIHTATGGHMASQK
jgi:hypothetical protein